MREADAVLQSLNMKTDEVKIEPKMYLPKAVKRHLEKLRYEEPKVAYKSPQRVRNSHSIDAATLGRIKRNNKVDQ